MVRRFAPIENIPQEKSLEAVVTCPVCDEPMEIHKAPKTWYGQCANCLCRVYAPFYSMKVIIEKTMKEEEEERAPKAKATAKAR